ncbi:unnamed protein product [Phyllotreta striolata]|uniref:Palmitoyltransferase n=1 Tax=Phyllotreta striolata TaxID=444603 RepID=A0A9N9XTF4_PHYSR|nr:unnamed protein product [Phyllotreta striolata]
MRLRASILPKTFKETFATGFLIVNIPLHLYSQLFFVLPGLYEPWSADYNLRFGVIVLLTLMAFANLLATMLSDPSVAGRIPKGRIVADWKYCARCERSAPPRSWHCKICDVCVLKRDHHCLMMSCCVGHDNLRYFFCYLFFQMACAAYGTVLNACFLWNSIEPGCLWKAVLKVAFPFVGMFFVDWSSYQFHFCLMVVLFSVAVVNGFLFVFYVKLLVRNITLFENKKIGKEKFNRGLVENIKVVLGERWYLVWLGPWVHSKLTGDGMHWN